MQERPAFHTARQRPETWFGALFRDCRGEVVRPQIEPLLLSVRLSPSVTKLWRRAARK